MTLYSMDYHGHYYYHTRAGCKPGRVSPGTASFHSEARIYPGANRFSYIIPSDSYGASTPVKHSLILTGASFNCHKRIAQTN